LSNQESSRIRQTRSSPQFDQTESAMLQLTKPQSSTSSTLPSSTLSTMERLAILPLRPTLRPFRNVIDFHRSPLPAQSLSSNMSESLLVTLSRGRKPRRPSTPLGKPTRLVTRLFSKLTSKPGTRFGTARTSSSRRKVWRSYSTPRGPRCSTFSVTSDQGTSRRDWEITRSLLLGSLPILTLVSLFLINDLMIWS